MVEQDDAGGELNEEAGEVVECRMARVNKALMAYALARLSLAQ